jgi:molybdate transport system permease protein
MTAATGERPAAPARAGSDAGFFAALAILGGTYFALIVLLLIADVLYTTPGHFVAALAKEDIRYSIKLTLISCTLTALLSLCVAVPLGYALSRLNFFGKSLIDAVLDIPIILPPLVVGLSLLILFQFRPFSWIGRWVVYEVPGVVVAQFMVAAAFAVRTMRLTFDQLDPRREQVAWTLGCTRAQAFWMVVWPETRNGRFTALALAWARALGEFGPLLVFAGATRRKTEVLSTTVFLELSVGDLEAAVAVSLLMVIGAVAALLAARRLGLPHPV